MELDNRNIKRVPINRNNLFYSEESFQFDVELGKNYYEQDMNQTVILYEVDLEKTNGDSVYQEAKKDGIRFKTPVELHVRYLIDSPELKTYDSKTNLGVYLQAGKLNFTVFQATLDELECDIKKGDYIGVQVTNTKMIYYTVVNDGKINYDNAHTVYGYKPYYRTIQCAIVDTNEFNGK